MVTINVSQETKERFRIIKLKKCADDKKGYSEEDFVIILLDKFEGKKI